MTLTPAEDIFTLGAATLGVVGTYKLTGADQLRTNEDG